MSRKRSDLSSLEGVGPKTFQKLQERNAYVLMYLGSTEMASMFL
jgi:endonuclease III